MRASAAGSSTFSGNFDEGEQLPFADAVRQLEPEIVAAAGPRLRSGPESKREVGVAHRPGVRRARLPGSNSLATAAQRLGEHTGVIHDGEGAVLVVDHPLRRPGQAERQSHHHRQQQDAGDERLAANERAELGLGDDQDFSHGWVTGVAILTKMSCSDGRVTSK